MVVLPPAGRGMVKRDVSPGIVAVIVAVILIAVGIFAYSMFFKNPYASPLTPDNMKEFNAAQQRSAIRQHMNSGGGSRGMHNAPPGPNPQGVAPQ